MSDRLGDGFAHDAYHSTANKWICAAWRDAEANTTSGSVYLGDKQMGLQHYSQFNATYIPEIINVTGGDDGRPGVDEIKNYVLCHQVHCSPRRQHSQHRGAAQVARARCTGVQTVFVSGAAALAGP